jgi:AcrR family transcriptional regulator
MMAARSARKVQADDTRARLFAAAARLFASRGYHETTVDQIAREAGVAKGTFFVHFATKDRVITELVGKQVWAAKKARERAGASPVDRLRAAVLTLGEQAGVSRELSRAVLSATLASAEVGSRAGALFEEVLEGMVADVEEGQKTGVFARVPDALTVAHALMASYLGAALHFTTSTDSRPLAEMLVPIVEGNLAGFSYRPLPVRGKGPHINSPPAVKTRSPKKE